MELDNELNPFYKHLVAAVKNGTYTVPKAPPPKPNPEPVREPTPPPVPAPVLPPPQILSAPEREVSPSTESSGKWSEGVQHIVIPDTKKKGRLNIVNYFL